MLKLLLAIALFAGSFCLAAETKPFRKYEYKVTDEEKEHVSFIICTLGFKSLPKVWSERSSLKHRGDKIDHLHPLRMLLCIFTDEEMKAAMGNLQGRSFVWSEFKKGLFDSLEGETKKGNMTPKYIEDFAKKVQIDSHLIIRTLEQERWDEFISLLIKHVPRAGNPKRYDM